MAWSWTTDRYECDTLTWMETGAELVDVTVAPLAPERFRDVLSAEALERFRTIARGRELLEGRKLWNVNSTARGGGVAEMLRSLVGYGAAPAWTLAGW